MADVGNVGEAAMTPAMPSMSQIVTRFAPCSAITSIRGDQMCLEIRQGALDHLAICMKMNQKSQDTTDVKISQNNQKLTSVDRSINTLRSVDKRTNHSVLSSGAWYLLFLDFGECFVHQLGDCCQSD